MAVSWIPSEAIEGLMRLPMDIGIGHYDAPPPDHIDDIAEFVDEGLCRFANRLEAWVEIEDGKIVAGRCSGTGLVGAPKWASARRTSRLRLSGSLSFNPQN